MKWYIPKVTELMGSKSMNLDPDNVLTVHSTDWLETQSFRLPSEQHIPFKKTPSWFTHTHIHPGTKNKSFLKGEESNVHYLTFGLGCWSGFLPSWLWSGCAPPTHTVHHFIKFLNPLPLFWVPLFLLALLVLFYPLSLPHLRFRFTTRHPELRRVPAGVTAGRERTWNLSSFWRHQTASNLESLEPGGLPFAF